MKTLSREDCGYKFYDSEDWRATTCNSSQDTIRMISCRSKNHSTSGCKFIPNPNLPKVRVNLPQIIINFDLFYEDCGFKLYRAVEATITVEGRVRIRLPTCNPRLLPTKQPPKLRQLDFLRIMCTPGKWSDELQLWWTSKSSVPIPKKLESLTHKRFR